MEKENQIKSVSGGSRRRRNHNTSEDGNDFVLKRYRLEQNQNFKDTTNQEMQFQTQALDKQIQKAPIEEDEDLVIVPFQLPPEEEELEEPQTIYMFDDEEVEEQVEKTQEKVNQEAFRNQFCEPRGGDFMGKLKKKENILYLKPLQDGHLRNHDRTDFSTAELMTPKSIPSNNCLDLHTIRRQQELESKAQYSSDGQQQSEVEESRQVKKIKGVELGQNNAINIVDKKVFAISKLPSGIILRCIIKRTNNFLNMLSPQYDLFLANGLKHILSAKKFPMRNRELFKFSTDPDKFAEPNLLSTMHANVHHNIYWMLDKPKKINNMDLSLVQLVIGYYHLKETRKHRKFISLLPNMNASYQLAINYDQPYINFSAFKDQIKVQINNLQDWQSKNDNSSKNFALADEDDPDYRYLELEKESDNIFELTIQHPLSPLQAMAIAMTRFDVQLK